MSIKPMHLFVILMVIVITFSLSPTPARADIAPPQQPPGSSLEPGEEGTQVRMLAETVIIDVQRHTPEGSLGQAQVTATFKMQNQGESPETMAVRFPISVNDGFFYYPELANLQVYVDGVRVPVRLVTIPDDYDDPITWAEFDVTFPPGEVVMIEVTYLLEGTGEYPNISFNYLLETGAGWADTIGLADLIVRLPYEANQQNIIFDEQIGWSLTTPGGEIMGNEIYWRFEDLEPTREHNFQVSLVMPSVWNKVLVERDRVAADPEDGETWGRLGKNYKEIISLRRWQRADEGGLELYELGKSAYQNAVTLLPDDAWWHAGYAEHLWRGYNDPLHPGTLEDFLLALQELDHSVRLDPDNELALNILNDISYFYPEAVIEQDGSYSFQWLTVTPEFTQTPSPTVEPSVTPTQTLPASPSATPLPPTTAPETSLTSEPAIADSPAALATEVDPQSSTGSGGSEDDSSGFSVCGAALLVPLLPLMFVVVKRRN
jgi:hypothetical protein